MSDAASTPPKPTVRVVPPWEDMPANDYPPPSSEDEYFASMDDGFVPAFDAPPDDMPGIRHRSAIDAESHESLAAQRRRASAARRAARPGRAVHRARPVRAVADPKVLREELAPRHADCPVVNVEMPPASSYDDLLARRSHVHAPLKMPAVLP
nr:hypothetical protein [Caballeronia sp. INDeC2]